MASVLADQKAEVFNRVALRLRFRDKVLAGTPKGGSTLDYYLDSKFGSDDAKADFRKRIADGKLTEDEMTAIKETSWCVFERDEHKNLCLWHGNAKAMMREIFTTMGYTQIRHSNKTGEMHAGGKQTLQHMVHVNPLRLVFRKANNETFQEPSGAQEVKVNDDSPEIIKIADGYVDKVKHIEDASGRRSALGRHDFLFQPEIEMELMWPADGCYTEEQLKLAWSACEEDGLGACRSQGFGKFDVVKWEQLSVRTKRRAKPEDASEEAVEKTAKKGKK